MQTVERGVHMTLQDETGPFLEVEPPTVEDPPPDIPPERSEEETATPDAAMVRALSTEVESLRTELEAQKTRVRELWRLNCDQLAEMDSLLLQKDEEIGSLQAELAQLRGTSPTSSAPSVTSEEIELGMEDSPRHTTDRSHRVRRGKAPPVDTFTGEDAESRVEDWLPAL